MAKKTKNVLMVSILIFVQLFSYQVTFSSVSDLLNGNAITPDQKTYGKWVPDKWLAAGWSGYHIIAKTVKANRIVSYSCGEDCTNYIRNAQGGSDLCPDGDCRYSKHAFIYQLGEGDFLGKRVPAEGYLGSYIAEDSGSVESSAIVNVDNSYLARFDETEAQQQNFLSHLRFNEGQVTTLIGFDKNGNSIQRGHIEEADAPWQINQTESYYKMTSQGPKFITTVVEKIYTTTVDGKEGIRGGTFWCNVDDFQLTTKSWKKFFKNDDFNFATCKKSRGQMYSDGSNEIAQAFQAGDSRVNSEVSLFTSNEQTYVYKASADKCGLGGFSFDCDGTQYFIDMKQGSKQKRIVHVNAERIKWSMKNKSSDNFSTFVNYPNAKLISLNFKKQDKFKGNKDYDEWLLNKDKTAVALLLYEKTDETYAGNLKGEMCAYKKNGEFGGYTFAGSEAFSDNESIARYCKMFKKYTLHYYILFPPEINGQKMTTYEKMALLDRVLAAMPDQTQPSKELNAAEEFGDVIQVLARDNATQNPAQATNFDILVDLATEEDSTTAGRKTEDLFYDLGFINERRFERVEDKLPEATTEDAAPEMGGEFDDVF